MTAPLDSPEVQAFAQGFPIVLLHAAVTLLLLAGSLALYGRLSHAREIARMREGDRAAAVAFAGAVLALAIPLSRAMAASTALIEVLLWGVMTLAVQLLIIRLADFVLKGLPDRAAQGDVTAAIGLSAARLAGALVLAAAVSG